MSLILDRMSDTGMLISKIPDNDREKGESVAVSEEENDSDEYQTANQLFELMAKNQNFDTTDVNKLTTRDLVLLYKNIDLGTNLMTNATELRCKKPNQHFESVVYNDEADSDSDVSDMYSNEDLRSMFLINSERLDLLTAPISAENTLCHKLGDLEMQTSNLTTEYKKHCLFKDPYIKEQLKSLKLINKSSDFDGTVLPASLLDYICCKRLEDNYNFYMDNILRYVKNTIEQLKRISNGDYLTDKAKEKWREVENTAEDVHANTKVLATSTSIPLHVERKISGQNTTWDDIVHSAVDIRSLSKILEKKIVLEIPKLLCGPYKLLSKCCAENLIISCKKEKRPVQERVDVVLQLQRSETGQVISNINSIMILQSAPVECDSLGPDVMPLPLSYIEQTNDEPAPERKPNISESEPMIKETVHDVSVDSGCSTHSSDNLVEESFHQIIDYGCSDNDVTVSLKNSGYPASTDSSDPLKGILGRHHKTAQKEVTCDVFPDDFGLTIRKLTMQSALTEESGEEMSQSTSKKKKSPTRVRVKSPYENQSFIMEEKKRRKLLEIRERRERKKMALVENCKITKHKYAKGNAMPQSASSVTKFTISNKSFYNSIYGHSTNVDPNNQEKKKNRKGGNQDVLDINMDDIEGEHDLSEVSTSEMNSQKYINRSYFLDDAVTEMMYANMKQNENDAKDLCSTSTSILSNEFRNNINYLSQLIGPSDSDLIISDDIFSDKSKPLSGTTTDKSISKELLTCQSILNKAPSNSPNMDKQDNTEPKKLTSSVECRKSIDKIYTLMNKSGKAQEAEHKSTKTKFVVSFPKKVDEREGRTISTCQGSESGTSLKHHIPSSNLSSFGSDKNNNEKPDNTHKKKTGSLSPVVPRIIISSKSSLNPKNELESNRKNRRRSATSPTKVSENPLKAISQFLHEFENVQKTRQKPITEQKHAKKGDVASTDGKCGSRKNSLKRRSRLDKHNESQTEMNLRLLSPKDMKCKQQKDMDLPKYPYKQTPIHDKHAERLPRKKIIEVLDEVKEARGEAVRGPSKFNSRLNSLAQPKRSYVQAHSEEIQTKYGKTLMTDRLQRLAAAPALSLDRPAGSANTRNKAKRTGSETVPAAGTLNPRPPAPPPQERAFRTRHSASSSPVDKERLNQVTGSSYKQANVPETPQALKKKMVAVESYVKNHYGRSGTSSPVGDPQSAQKSRVPLLPNDIELASSTSSAPFQESTELGSRLHNLISSIIRTSTSQGLEVLTECQESNFLAQNISSAERLRTSSDSEYVLDILDDNNVITSVENIDIASEKEQKQTEFRNICALQNDLKPVKSVVELEKLGNALSNHIPVGKFQKRLRIKNLTMTPKQSRQQVFLLQSGDAGSLIVQTPIAQNIKEKSDENFCDLTALPILSKSHLDWRFSNFPMTISTVGYAFPEYKTQRGSNSLIQLFDEVSIKSEQEKPSLTDHKYDKDSNTYQNAQPTLRIEQAAQVDDLIATTLVTVGISSTFIDVKELNKTPEIKQVDDTNVEPKHNFKNFSRIEKVKGPYKDEKSQVQIHTVIEKKENLPEPDKPDNIEYTTSLDILVGLLNEIQNISTCQTQMTKGDKSPPKDQQSKVLETILINDDAALGNFMKSSGDVVSFTSLDRLRQLESNPSLYSFYLSDNEGSEKVNSQLNFPAEIIPDYTNELWCPKRIYVDKEVGVDFIDREAVSKLPDLPSQMLSSARSRSTNMANSLIRVLSEPSIQSIFSAEIPAAVNTKDTSLDDKSIIKIPHILITTEPQQSLDFYNVSNQIIEKPNENKAHKNTMEACEKESIKNMRKVNNAKFRFKTDFDPVMKMKRDVLVTVYSILVFTVFAFLSFPEMLYRI